MDKYDVVRHYDHYIDVTQERWSDGITARIRFRNPINGEHWLLIDGTFAKARDDGLIDNYMPLRIEADAAQRLIDGLWDMGLRPTNHPRGELPALQRHLEDMRRIAFGALARYGAIGKEEK